MAKAKAKKPKLEVVKPEKRFRYAITRVPVHGQSLEFCDSDCQFLAGAVCALDPIEKITLEKSKNEFKRHKVCVQSSVFVYANIERAKMEKILGG